MRLNEMPLIVIYDVEDTKVRNRIHEACLDYGLRSVQYSAFCGRLWRGKAVELMARLRRELGKATGHVILIPVRDREWKNARCIGAPLGISQVPFAYVV